MRSQIKSHILLIDDSTIDLRLLMEMMPAHQMRVNVAFSGQSGYHKAAALQPDLILLDISMPEVDGFATCRMLKNNEHTRHIPVIFLSAANEMEKRIKGLSLGAIDYICKPFSEHEVIARIGVHLNLVFQRRPVSPIKNLDQPDHNQEITQRDDVLIRISTDYLRQHLRLPPSPSTLAKIMRTNEIRLNQVFQTEFAMPMSAWLCEERLHQAHHLLASTETSISSIGEHLGYSRVTEFSRAFRERFGCSPVELRVALKKDQPLMENAGN